MGGCILQMQVLREQISLTLSFELLWFVPNEGYAFRYMCCVVGKWLCQKLILLSYNTYNLVSEL